MRCTPSDIGFWNLELAVVASLVEIVLSVETGLGNVPWPSLVVITSTLEPLVLALEPLVVVITGTLKTY